MSSFENLKMYWQLSPFTKAPFPFVSRNNLRVLTELIEKEHKFKFNFHYKFPFPFREVIAVDQDKLGKMGRRVVCMILPLVVWLQNEK